MPAGWKEKIATIEMNSVKASINEDRKTCELSITIIMMMMMMIEIMVTMTMTTIMTITA